MFAVLWWDKFWQNKFIFRDNSLLWWSSFWWIRLELSNLNSNASTKIVQNQTSNRIMLVLAGVLGLLREPKYGHLKDLHKALRLSQKALLWGVPSIEKISEDLEVSISIYCWFRNRNKWNYVYWQVKDVVMKIRTYEKPGTQICAAFLNNNSTKSPETIKFRGQDYYLPRKSISILPDCKTMVFNTQSVTSRLLRLA